VPINSYTDRGQNKIIVTLDPEGLLKEKTTSNNTVSKLFSITEDAVKPVYPSNFGIVNDNKIKLVATTSQFTSLPKNFIIEVDTTEKFNSPFKVSQVQSSLGGIIEFNPSFQMKDSVVYYWHVSKAAEKGDTVKWSGSSFVYLSKSGPGWNQSHFFQFKSGFSGNVVLNDARETEFQEKKINFKIRTAIFNYDQNIISNDLNFITRSGCRETLNSLEFVLINKRTGLPIKNLKSSTGGTFNAYYDNTCSPNTPNQLWFSYLSPVSRKAAAIMIDSIPNDHILILINWASTSAPNQYANEWKKDSASFGVNNSIYHKLKSIGFSLIDSFTNNKPFLFIASKENNGWKMIDQQVGGKQSDILYSECSFIGRANSATAEYELIGPAKKWNEIKWSGYSLEKNSADELNYKVYGISKDFRERLLFTSISKNIDTG
jgi:hypothetical protein